MIRYNGYIAMISCLFLVVISSLVSADENNQMQISNVQIEPLSYIGQEAVVAFDLRTVVDINNAYINVMLESAMTDEEYIEYLEASASDEEIAEGEALSGTPSLGNSPSDDFSTFVEADMENQASVLPTIIRPKYYLATVPVAKLLADKLTSFSLPIIVPSAVVPGRYIISIDIKSGITSEVTAVVENMPSTSPLSFSFPEEHVLVQPDLPNLKLVDVSLAGNHGHALSKSDLPNVIRLNLSVSAMLKDVGQTIRHSFSLSIPNAGDYALSIRQEDPERNEYQEIPEWKLEAECINCAVLKKGSTKSAALSLLIGRDLKEKILGLPSGSVISLNVQTDSLNEIPEWKNNKKDNIVILKIAVLD